MTVVAAVVARLEALGAVTALVSDRIVATILDQDTEKPAVLVQLVSKAEGLHLRGPMNIKRARIQIDSVALTKAGADELAAAVHGDGLGRQASGLWGYQGEVGTSPSFRFEVVQASGEREYYEPPPNREYRVQRDYLIDYQGDS